MANPQPSTSPNAVPLWKILTVSIGAIAWVALLNAYRWAIPSQFGFTPAGVCTSAEVLSNFLDQGGNPNTRVVRTRSPVRISLLECSLLAGRKDSMRVLIEHGANLEQRSQVVNRLNRGGTVLHWAILQQDTAAAVMLLEAGADVNARFDYLLGCAFCSGTYDIAPIHLAASTGQVAMVEVLLNYGGDTTIQDGEGSTALQIAAKFRHQDMVQFLEAQRIEK